jgi:hypothetical protein
MRAKQAWRNDVMQGKTLEQQLAAQKRRHFLPKNRFKETGFLYTGDTVVIWNIREYYDNVKWRDEAKRRSKRRQQALEDGIVDAVAAPRRLFCSRKRFRALVEQRYREHLQLHQTTEENTKS